MADPIRPGRVVGCAIEGHRHPGPGWPESACEDCRCSEPGRAGPAFRRPVGLPIVHKEMRLASCNRRDILVADLPVIAVKPVARVRPVHEAQRLTYLRMRGLRAGLVLNFNHAVPKEVIRRVVT